MQPKIFNKFDRINSTGDGESVFDFLGGSIRAEYKDGWRASQSGRKLMPNYPITNEWYVDWIACLVAAYNGRDSFQVVELGAGYAQWMVTSIRAFKSLNPDCQAFGLALEADQIHYNWMLQHVAINFDRYNRVETDLILAAAGSDGKVYFPVLEDPAKHYGKSVVFKVNDGAEPNLVTVDSMSLKSIYDRLKDREVDLLHVDVQGSEVELLINKDVTQELARTKSVMVGTHPPDAIHGQVRDVILSAGFKIIIDWPQSSTVQFVNKDIVTNDGALFAINPLFVNEQSVRELIKPSE